MIQAIKEQIKSLELEAYKLKTKQAKLKRYESIKALRNQAIHLLHDEVKAFATHTVKGMVESVGYSQDYLYASTPYGKIMLYQCNDELSKSWYVETCCIEYSKGQEITIEIDIEVNYESLSLNLITKTIRGGQLNESKYSSLCENSNLAFFQYPSGMSGLFSKVGA